MLQIQNMTRKKKKKCKGEGREIYQNGFMKCSLVVFANPSSCRNWRTKSGRLIMKCTMWLILNDSHRDIHKTGEGAHEQCVKEGEEVPL